jgi:hypothetical protein
MSASGLQPTPTNTIWGKEASKGRTVKRRMRRSREEIKVPAIQHMMRQRTQEI